jgi:predicted negative regulator of RcsB-dependent stress response
VDKQEKEFLKHDVFVEEVAHGVDFVTSHKKQVILYGVLALALVAGIFGYRHWSTSQAEQRQATLREALDIQQGAVGPGDNPFIKVFPTQEAKDAAAVKAFNEVIAKHPSSSEASIAAYYLGIIAADKGQLAEAEKQWKSVADKGNAEYASLAKFSLAQVYAKQGKTADAEQILRSLIASPTVFVSKENAQIELAKILATTKPDEAQKILEPLRQMSTRNAVSRWAITAFGDTRPKP